jgi:NAD(P)-dependent dehydrogenase (short-subunit alcohol dehydrogenase family)
VDRIVLVTGGSGGIGKAVAARFLAEGDSVIITGRDQQRLADTASEIGAKPVTCDGSNPVQVARLSEEVGDRLDVLVNAAGGNTDFQRDGDGGQSLEQVSAAWRANLGKLRPGGTIINISSIGAEHASTSYGAAKAALAAWTAGLSAEAGPGGVTANVISPGYIAETGFFRGRLTAERRAQLIGATHTKRAGQPDDVAATAVFLASAGARHVTGQTIHVNGGAHTTR